MQTQTMNTVCVHEHNTLYPDGIYVHIVRWAGCVYGICYTWYACRVFVFAVRTHTMHMCMYVYAVRVSHVSHLHAYASRLYSF